MKKTIRLWVSTIGAAVLSGLYWFTYFLAAESWTASDYRAGSEPGEAFLTFKVAVAIVLGPLLFAALMMGWRSVENLIRKDR